MNPTELFRVGGANGDQNWRIRVITNKYPITDLHEVIIHSPDHLKDIDELPEEHIELLFQTYRQRYNFHMHEGNGQVIIFNNHDAHAGASLRHPHSQIVVVPGQINLDTVPREPVSNLVIDNKFFYLYCPDFSQWPYELWIAPKKLGTVFGEITDEEIKDLVPLLKKSLQFIIKKFREMGAMRKGGDDLDEVPYNYYLYHGTDWYLRIIPRLIHRAGFELGTGLSVNIVDPAIAAEEYRAGLAG
jgi:UDPglucose--hexose-1-phosphate uridylyltransferase